MNLIEAEEKRITRWYQWSLNDAIREISEDFPLIGTIKSPLVDTYLNLIGSLPYQEQVCLSTALVKRWHPAALQLLGETLSDKDQSYINLYVNTVRSRPVAFSYHDETVSRKRIAQIVIQNLSGLIVLSRRPGLVFYGSHSINDWCVDILVDVGSRHSLKLCYTHQIYRKDKHTDLEIAKEIYDRFGPGPVTQASTSVLEWMGLGLTEWKIKNEQDAEEASISLKKVCSHLFTEIPTILEGLSM